MLSAALTLTLTLVLAPGVAVASAPKSSASKRVAAKPAANALCPTCGGKVDARSPQVQVQGRAYRVCCPDCGAQLKAKPGAYLAADGTPKKAL